MFAEGGGEVVGGRAGRLSADDLCGWTFALLSRFKVATPASVSFTPNRSGRKYKI